MSVRQAKLCRLAAQHDFQAVPVAGSDRVVEITIPGVLVATGEPCTSTERVSTVEEMLLALGY